MLPVSSAISQAQWTWFSRERPFYDFHVFDQASRGAWGSLILLLRMADSLPAFRCAQGYPYGLEFFNLPHHTASYQLPLTRRASRVGRGKASAIRTIIAPKDKLDTGTRKALLMATAEDGSNFLRPIEPLGATCSTGNCTFDTYQSLGVCMKMATITSQLRIQEFDDVKVGEMPLLGDDKGASFIPGQKVRNASLPGGYDMSHQTSLAGRSCDGQRRAATI
ncbi:uncharacterized protein BDZ99DRAFT_525387 [Mytilinidion resinicola]|uniref:Uncharacterized protein n=1 Tax=Mytilinidion resinicola TaxID=574789 RepID=A0A6A6Y6V0_9PEZI|nr:uncharacterized protein BDZ99DRAFT_525387 [Mytilinidion resinicola]KAF2804551.1 hypothetical protein BDZ99DRAFT_525387 [Mytilinidion resinicola]